MKKKGITLERHKEIGKELFAMRQSLAPLVVEIGNAYPFSGKLSEPHKDVAKALSLLDGLRCNLEDNLFIENSNLGDEGMEIYYPSRI
jgi:hypothetical protein